MAGSLNRVTLIGNVGRDPEIRSTQDGREIANLTLATTDSWKDKMSGERRERTEWHRVVIFAPPLVNLVRNYIAKGSKLYIEGALQTRKWVDSNGNDRHSTEVVLQPYSSTLLMLNGKNSTPVKQQSESATNLTNETNESFDSIDDEIPF